MAANTQPRFTLTGDPSSNSATGMAPTLTTAAADYTGVSANNKVAFTGGTNGSRISGLRLVPIGTNVQTVARFYLNNGSSAATASNNSYIGALTLPSTTAQTNIAEPFSEFYFPGGYLDVPAGWTVLVGLGTTVAAGWVVTPVQGAEF